MVKYSIRKLKGSYLNEDIYFVNKEFKKIVTILIAFYSDSKIVYLFSLT